MAQQHLPSLDYGSRIRKFLVLHTLKLKEELTGLCIELGDCSSRLCVIQEIM